MKTVYVVGFAFSADKQRILLMTKARPDWQKGLLNGIGGKLEPFDDRHVDAMCREFYKETTLKTVPSIWSKVCELTFHDDIVLHVFATVLSKQDEQFLLDNCNVINSKTSEPISWNAIKMLSSLRTVPNVQWLVPFALDSYIEFDKLKAIPCR